MHFLCNSLIINRYYFCCFLRFFCCFGKKGKKKPLSRGKGAFYILYYKERVYVRTCTRITLLQEHL